jgi:Flagellar protein FliT
MTDKAQNLQQLISLSRAMLGKAREESWDDVVVLEAERSELIRLFFLEPVPQACADAVAAGIQAMMAIDNELMELGALKKFDLAQALQNMDQGKKAVKAYAS